MADGMNLTVVREDGANLLAMAVEKNLDVDKLEKLIALRNAEIERQNQEAFETHFAAMQADLITVRKEKAAKDGSGKTMYKYAPLELLQEVNGPVIAKHGFSYSWREEAIPEGKRVVMRISGWGHSKETSFDVPMVQGTQRMNAVQVAGAMSSYGMRYTFKAGFGIVVADEDQDAIELTAGQAMDYSAQLATIANCKTMADLQGAWAEVWKTVGNDTLGKRVLTEAKDKKKAELNAGN